jgi:hypothetical protein
MKINLKLVSATLVVGMAGFLPGPTVELSYAQDNGNNVRPRARDLGIIVGKYEPGKWNAITDVSGVTVGQVTLFQGDGPLRPGKGQKGCLE